MQHLLQVLFFVTIISAVFASSAGPNGCQEGKVWTTASSTKCTRHECYNNKIRISEIPQPCKTEGTAYQFFSYPEIIEPPSGRPFVRSTDEPLISDAKTTEPEFNLGTARVLSMSLPPKKPHPYTY